MTGRVGPRGWALVALLCGPFLSMVDSSAVNVAVPRIVEETGESLTVVAWAVNAYLLGIAACLPLTGAAVSRFGLRRVYAVAVLAFGVTSAACAAAPGVEVLLAGRALQGVASAPLVPLALAMLFGEEGDRHGSPVAGLLLFLAPALGPTLGALVMETPLGWRGIFLLNLPVVAVALLSIRAVPAERPVPGRPAEVDLVATALLVAGSVTATVGTSLIADVDGPFLALGLALAGAGAVVLTLWAVRVRRRRGTDLAPYLLGSARHRSAVLTSLVASTVLFGVLFLAPVYLVGAGWSLLGVGLVLIPQGLAMGLSHPVGQALQARWGLQATVSAGLLLLVASSLSLLLVDADSGAPLVAAVLTMRGLALGLTLQPLIMGLMRSVPGDQVTGVSTLFTISQRVGASLGIALIAALYHALSVRGSAESAFHDTVVVLAALSAIAMVPASRLPRRPGTPAEVVTGGAAPALER